MAHEGTEPRIAVCLGDALEGGFFGARSTRSSIYGVLKLSRMRLYVAQFPEYEQTSSAKFGHRKYGDRPCSKVRVQRGSTHQQTAYDRVPASSLVAHVLGKDVSVALHASKDTASTPPPRFQPSNLLVAATAVAHGGTEPRRRALAVLRALVALCEPVVACLPVACA